MHVKVNGTTLYFDVEGAGLIPDGSTMRSKPTLILLHGGPGFDHTSYKPAFSVLADVAQILYLDHRGSGRSAASTPDNWTLAKWADDLKEFCDTLGIVRPIVYGGSFGGFVAQSYATHYPDHPEKIILSSTAAKVNFDEIFTEFQRIGGPYARKVAEAYWLNPTAESRLKYIEVCLPLYHPCKVDSSVMERAIIRNDVAIWFNGPKNEHGRMDFRSDLARVRCPVLILCGDRDPVTPISFSETIAACLPPHLVRLERFPGCGHGVHVDDPARAFQVIRDFILA